MLTPEDNKDEISELRMWFDKPAAKIFWAEHAEMVQDLKDQVAIIPIVDVKSAMKVARMQAQLEKLIQYKGHFEGLIQE